MIFFKCDGNEASFESCQRSVNNDFNSEFCSSARVIFSRELGMLEEQLCLLSCIHAMYIFFMQIMPLNVQQMKAASEIIER